MHYIIPLGYSVQVPKWEWTVGLSSFCDCTVYMATCQTVRITPGSGLYFYKLRLKIKIKQEWNTKTDINTMICQVLQSISVINGYWNSSISGLNYNFSHKYSQLYRNWNFSKASFRTHSIFFFNHHYQKDCITV